MSSKGREELTKVIIIVTLFAGVGLGLYFYFDNSKEAPLFDNIDKSKISAFVVSGPISLKTVDGFIVTMPRVEKTNDGTKAVPEERRIILGPETKYELVSETGRKVSQLEESVIWEYLKVGNTVSVNGEAEEFDSYEVQAKKVIVLKVLDSNR